MGFRCGIVGLPNVGKSTLFNALTRSAAAQAANYAFCTIDPNVGIVEVPDPRLTRISDIVGPRKTVPTTIEFVDIAGLVAGASKGEGLGNRFLSHIREMDAVAHVVRAFDDSNVVHVADRVDPASDIETVGTELLLADMETADRALKRAEKNSKSGDKAQVAMAGLLRRVQACLEAGTPLRSLALDGRERAQLKPLCFLTAKPNLYIANVGEDGFEDNPHLETIRAIAEDEGAGMVAVCAAMEQELCTIGVEEAEAFLADMGFGEPGLDRVIRAGYRLLDLLTFFTAGPKEVRAWTVRTGATASRAAGVIHTDFERGFIRAETTGYDDFIDCGGEQGAREAGKLRLEGRDYRVQDGDIMYFRFNV